METAQKRRVPHRPLRRCLFALRAASERILRPVRTTCSNRSKTVSGIHIHIGADLTETFRKEDLLSTNPPQCRQTYLMSIGQHAPRWSCPPRPYDESSSAHPETNSQAMRSPARLYRSSSRRARWSFACTQGHLPRAPCHRSNPHLLQPVEER